MTSPLNRQYRPGSSSSFICEPTTITTTGFPIPANSNQPQYHFEPSRLHRYIASKQGTHASHTSSDSPPLTDSDSTRPDTPTALQIRGSEVEQRGGYKHFVPSTGQATAPTLSGISHHRMFTTSVCRYFADAIRLQRIPDSLPFTPSMRKEYCDGDAR